MRSRGPHIPGLPVSGLVGLQVFTPSSMAVVAGTLTGQTAWTQRVGNLLFLWANALGGSATTGAFSMNLPTGYTAAISAPCGQFARLGGTNEATVFCTAGSNTLSCNSVTIAIGPTFGVWAVVPIN